ncbi:MAG: ABC transporter permease [Syntrophomonadaceae bacterium]|jgi:cell division transport system permease protein|nr:ABC transporter permease [Syntrophomonadaceae bacterium]
MLRNIRYFCREALQSMGRNRLLSLATISTVAICILILGMAVLATLNASHFITRLESDLEIMSYLNKDLTQEQISQIKEELEAIPGVDTVRFVSREEALQYLQDSYGKDRYNLKETMGKNPLPDGYEIKALDPHDVPVIAQQVEQVPGIDRVNYGKEMVHNLFIATRWVRILSLAFIVLLSLGAVFLIATTIRLAIFSRRKEIYLMKLIGSTDWFVRWPFFIEGILLGTMGSLIAILLLAIGYETFIGSIQSVPFVPVLSNRALLLQVYAGLVVIGAVLGVLGTYISLNRFLDV